MWQWMNIYAPRSFGLIQTLILNLKVEEEYLGRLFTQGPCAVYIHNKHDEGLKTSTHAPGLSE